MSDAPAPLPTVTIEYELTAAPAPDDARDAARYRWLKECALEYNIKRQAVVVAEFVAPIAYGPNIDDAIDAAMQEKP